jgi:pilus assembly protein CpaF
MSDSLIDRVRERLAAESAPLRPNVVAAAIRAESGGVLGDTEVLSNLRVLETELTGAGVLEPLLRADGTTDVLVTSPEDVWVDDGNGLRRSDIRFTDEAAVRRLAQRLAAAAGRRLDDAQPWVDGQLADIGGGRFTVRLHAVLPPVAADGTCLSLRVLRPAAQDLAALTAAGAIGAQARELIDGIIAARLAFLVSGGTGAGKTTLLSAALGAVPASERIVCVEDAAELAPRHPHLVRLVARGANVEGAGEITLRQLVRQALRMRPDRIVVGEVRGAEVVDLLAALNTGHDGGAGTVHANSPAEVPARLEALAAVGGLDRGALHSQLAAAVQAVVHVSRGPAGRRVEEIAQLRRDGSGCCYAVPVWRADGAAGGLAAGGLTDAGLAEAGASFRRLIESRRRS